MMNILLIDNFDSFTYNLVEEFESLDARVVTLRNDTSVAIALESLSKMPKPSMVVFSPGPGHPKQAGLCVQLLKELDMSVPVLGICLGHQVIVEAFGGEVLNSNQIVHGKTSPIVHNRESVFSGLESPLVVGRYHSLVATKLPDTLKQVAHYEGIVMAVSHVERPIIGLQFHPESLLTAKGSTLIQNVLEHFLNRGHE